MGGLKKDKPPRRPSCFPFPGGASFYPFDTVFGASDFPQKGSVFGGPTENRWALYFDAFVFFQGGSKTDNFPPSLDFVRFWSFAFWQWVGRRYGAAKSTQTTLSVFLRNGFHPGILEWLSRRTAGQGESWNALLVKEICKKRQLSKNVSIESDGSCWQAPSSSCVNEARLFVWRSDAGRVEIVCPVYHISCPFV